MKQLLLTTLILIVALAGCRKTNPKRVIDDRLFNMGFSSWPFGPEVADVDESYDFIFEHGDIYLEHLDDAIPWKAHMDGSPLPASYVSMIDHKAARRPADKELVLASGLLNIDRSELMGDYEGNVISYTALNAPAIEDAYVTHLLYLIDRFDPDYLICAIESNEFYLHHPDKWPELKALMTNVRARIKAAHPSLKLSESITLHNFYKADVPDPEALANELAAYMNSMDFAAVSFYPFFKQLNERSEFQDAFDFLHEKVSKPIAFAETTHLAEDLVVPNLDLDIKGGEKEQRIYLETLLNNAHNHNYEFVLWWTHRDFDALWETFPDEVKDLGQVWRDTGLLDEDGKERPAFKTWKTVFEK